MIVYPARFATSSSSSSISLGYNLFRTAAYLAGSPRDYHSSVQIVSSDEEATNLGTQNVAADSPRPSKGTKNLTARFGQKTHPVLLAGSLQHWFKNWQEKRRHKLTASTFAGAIGFWRRRRTQLWLEKIGAIEPFLGNPATCWNNIKEQEALERYRLITGNSVLFPDFQVYSSGENNQEDDWLAASPDGVIDQFVYGLPSGGVLEIKCPFFNGDKSMASPWKRVPLYCIPQAQGLMEILNRDWMDLYMWTPVGSSLFRLYRDSDYWDALKCALSDFWWEHVQPARELCRTHNITDPLRELPFLRPAPRHELCEFIVYESKRIVDSSRLLVREIHGHLQP